MCWWVTVIKSGRIEAFHRLFHLNKFYQTQIHEITFLPCVFLIISSRLKLKMIGDCWSVRSSWVYFLSTLTASLKLYSRSLYKFVKYTSSTGDSPTWIWREYVSHCRCASILSKCLDDHAGNKWNAFAFKTHEKPLILQEILINRWLFDSMTPEFRSVR